MGRSDEIVEELREYDSEREWFEFRENWFKADELGEYILASSNSAIYQEVWKESGANSRAAVTNVVSQIRRKIGIYKSCPTGFI